MRQFIRTTLNPAWYHGRSQKRPFFEGWYYKVIDRTEQHRYAFIPGVFLSREPHAFIQVLNGSTAAATYHDYAQSLFWAADDRFEVHIGANRFNANTLTLDIDTPGQQVRGTLRFGGNRPWPVTPLSPGIMGWYAWVPLMECYHGVLSLDHRIYGTLEIDGQVVDFEDGRGYIEKDWGRSFPQAWIWMQTNHFNTVETSLTGSVAIIPWVRQAFPGFIVGFWHQRKLHRFATYSGAKIEALHVTEDHVHWVLANRSHRLEIFARRGITSQFGLLKGPTTLEMGKRVAESLTAEITVQLSHLGTGKTLFVGTGRNAGLEVHNTPALLDLFDK